MSSDSDCFRLRLYAEDEDGMGCWMCEDGMRDDWRRMS
jgi:hypothetical protein